MTEDNIAIRLKFLISELGINSSVFADTCGISKATLSQLLTGRNKKVNDVLITQIHKAYPQLSIMWLLFNEGSMWINNDAKPTSDETSDQTISNIDQNPGNGPGNGSSYNSISSESGKPFQNLSEIPESSGVGAADSKFSEETGLNSQKNHSEGSIDQEINARLKTAALMNEIDILRSKIRKVVQITIYYDDSTFESFFPK